jgi:hypothetical protein
MLLCLSPLVCYYVISGPLVYSRLFDDVHGGIQGSVDALTVGGEDNLEERLIGDVCGGVDQLQHVGRAVVVPEQQDAVRQAVQPVVRDLDTPIQE